MSWAGLGAGRTVRRGLRLGASPLQCLVLLLCFQLFGLGLAPGQVDRAPAADNLGVLATVIGHSVRLCDHGGDGRSGPVDPHACDHCGFCCSLVGGHGLVPADHATILARVAHMSRGRPMLAATRSDGPFFGGARSRGPPPAA